MKNEDKTTNATSLNDEAIKLLEACGVPDARRYSFGNLIPLRQILSQLDDAELQASIHEKSILMWAGRFYQLWQESGIIHRVTVSDDLTDWFGEAQFLIELGKATTDAVPPEMPRPDLLLLEAQKNAQIASEALLRFSNALTARAKHLEAEAEGHDDAG